ncbi:MAG: pimeloyl-ACP methyl ester esterase BioH [Gammaproteobacteria bacterium]
MSLYTETAGSGTDLVMIHGWGLHSGVWDKFAPLLQAGFRVTRVDLPGHGRSDWQGAATLDEWVAAVQAVVPAPAVWLGWSLGGLLATRAAMLVPGDVAALITLASSPCFVRKPGWQSAMLPTLLENFAVELAGDYERTLTRFLSLQVRGSEHASAVLKTLRSTLLAQGAPATAALAAGLELLRTTDLRADMQAIACPLLMILGERDTLVPVNAGRETLGLCRDARLEVIDAAGHAPFLAAPETVARQINRFL